MPALDKPSRPADAFCGQSLTKYRTSKQETTVFQQTTISAKNNSSPQTKNKKFDNSKKALHNPDHSNFNP